MASSDVGYAPCLYHRPFCGRISRDKCNLLQKPSQLPKSILNNICYIYIDSVTYRGPDERFIKIALCFWTLTGLVQRFINRAFMTSLLSASRTSLDRGVVSLAVEPTTYGLFCLLLMIVCWEYFENGKVFYSALCLFQIIFLAQSSMAVLLLVVLALYVGIVYFAFSLRATTKIGVISVVGLGIICGYFFVNEFLFGTRVHVLMMAIFRDPRVSM